MNNEDSFENTNIKRVKQYKTKNEVFKTIFKKLFYNC